jgi:hypothetical protein
VVEEVAPHIQVEAEPEQRSDGKAPETRSKSRVRTEFKAADEHAIGRTEAARSLPFGAAGRGWPHGISACIGVDVNPGGGSMSLLEPGALAAISTALAYGNPRQG